MTAQRLSVFIAMTLTNATLIRRLFCQTDMNEAPLWGFFYAVGQIWQVSPLQLQSFESSQFKRPPCLRPSVVGLRVLTARMSRSSSSGQI